MLSYDYCNGSCYCCNVNARCYLPSVWNVHRESEKKQDTKLLPITPQILTDFPKKIFADRLISKFAQTYIYISHHTLNMSLHYLVKYECQQTGGILKYVL